MTQVVYLADALEALVEPVVRRQLHELVQVALVDGLARGRPDGGVHAVLGQVASLREGALGSNRVLLLVGENAVNERVTRCLYTMSARW
jgi:hypothetical protein